MQTFIHDLRYGFRLLLKNPGFTIAAVISLALGIGANTTVFSLVNAVLLRPLPVKQPEQLAELYTVESRADNRYLSVSYPDYTYFRDHTEVFSGVAAHALTMLSLSGDQRNELVWGQIVSGNYFSVLGIDPIEGRAFRPEEDRTPGGNPVAVISYGLWKRRFGGTADVVGKTLTLNRHSFTIVGVAPESFKGTVVGLAPEVWVPITMQAQAKPGKDILNSRDVRALFVVGRLKPEANLEQARAEAKLFAGQLEQSYKETNEGMGAAVTSASPLPYQFRSAVTGFMVFLMVVVGLVLLVPCANVANLLIARATARRREISIRLALGASRSRLIRQLLTESLLLAVLGGLVGLLITNWATKLLLAFQPPLPVQVALDLGLDRRVLIFTMVISIVTGLVFGTTPALQASRPDLVPTLKGEQYGASRTKTRLRNMLVVAQVALSLILLVGAGLFLRSLKNARSIDPGFDTENALAVSLDLQVHGYSEAQGLSFYRQLVQRAETLPGVESACVASHLPLGLEFRVTDVVIEGRLPQSDRDRVEADYSVVGPSYFKTLGIQLVSGRDFGSADNPSVPGVAIINESMARRFWPGEEPSGRRFSISGVAGPYLQVVGVAKDGKYRSLGETPRPFVYLPFEQKYASFMTLLVRTTGEPNRLLGSVREQVQSLDSSLPLFEARTLSQHLSTSLLPQRLAAALMGIFGILGLILATVGIYGVVAYSASQRTREIGIRMALGAKRSDVFKLVVGQGLRPTLLGLTLGVIASLGLSRVVSSLLFGVSLADPITFVGISLLLVTASLVASYIPARKATRINPIIALRYE